MGALEGLLDEVSHDDVAAHIDVLSQVETLPGRIDQAELDRLARLTGHVAAHGPFIPNIKPRGSIDVCLQTAGKVIEAGLVIDIPLQYPARKVGDLIRQLIPDTVEFVRRRHRRRFAARVVDDERVELDHLGVIVKRLHGGFPHDIVR